MDIPQLPEEMLYKIFGINKPITPKSVKSISTFDLKEIRKRVPFAKGAAQLSIIQAELDKRASKLDAECNRRYLLEKGYPGLTGFNVCSDGYNVDNDPDETNRMCHYRRGAPKTNFECENGNRIKEDGTLMFVPQTQRVIRFGEFQSRESIKNVTIPASVGAIGEKAFDLCRKLEKVDFEENSHLGFIGKNAFSICESLLEIQIPDSCHKIGEEAFSFCKELVKVTLPKFLNVIEKKTFSMCIKLTEIKFPEELRNIKSYAFEKCAQLQKIDLPDSVEVIKGLAFLHCTNLREIHMGAMLTEFENAFLTGGGCRVHSISIKNGATKKKFRGKKKELLKYMGLIGILPSAVKVVYL